MITQLNELQLYRSSGHNYPSSPEELADSPKTLAAPVQPPPGDGAPQLAFFDDPPKILADCVFLASQACLVAMRLAPNPQVAAKIRAIWCGFVSAGIWAYSYNWRLSLQAQWVDGELRLLVQLVGSSTPVYRGVLSECELDLLSLPIVAGHLRKVPSPLPPQPSPLPTSTVGQPVTYADALAQLLNEIDDGIQICSSAAVIRQLQDLKRPAASMAVTTLYHSPQLEVGPDSFVDHEPVIGLKVTGDSQSYRGQLYWSEFEPDARQLVAPLSGAGSWNIARQRSAS